MQLVLCFLIIIMKYRHIFFRIAYWELGTHHVYETTLNIMGEYN